LGSVLWEGTARRGSLARGREETSVLPLKLRPCVASQAIPCCCGDCNRYGIVRDGCSVKQWGCRRSGADDIS
jgi:hypothetical protein